MTDLEALIAEREAHRYRPIPRYAPEPMSADELADLVEEVTGHMPDGLTSNDRQKIKRAQNRAAVMADLELIWGTDAPTRCAQRLGYASVSKLSAALHKWGEKAWAERVTRRTSRT